ncbi:MAG: stalk domain-containing protein [Eubacteriales bacterium]|nr:stalk domain-containing protein [Eubacteriales bacterium]
MKKTKKILLALCLVLVFSTISYAAAHDNIRISINGEIVTPRDVNGNVVDPFIQDGTTYLPVRAVSNMLGSDVAWDAATKTVSITSNNEARQSSYFMAISDLWYVHNALEMAKRQSDLALNLYGNSVLHTQSNIDSVMNSVVETQEIIAAFRDGSYLQMPLVAKGYARCDAATKITYDNLKAFKNGKTAQNCVTSERINNTATFNTGLEVSEEIYDTLTYLNE